MFKLTVHGDKESRVFYASEGKSVFQILRENGFYLPAVCGERGTCGKCAIRLIKGSSDVSADDKMYFSDAELNAGKRPACRTYITGDTEISVSASDDSGFKILGFYKHPYIKHKMPDILPAGIAPTALGIAIDIGTTTICLEVLNLSDGTVAASHSCINRQRRYGADVISRISAANDGKLIALRDSVREDICDGISRALADAGLHSADVCKINISANTTMVHLLLGLSCQPLGAAPFKPVFTDKCERTFFDIFENRLCDCPVTVLPGISAFVGGDITSGILFCGAHTNDKYSLLIDLGTNGEMALCRKNEFLCTSTAAGPAFEGGNISCGTGGIPGAISEVRYKNSGFICETIGGKPPVGICGSGIMDAVACFVSNGFIDETGLLTDDYFETGVEIAPGVIFTQKDIRELQLAKSAVRAGIETLVKAAGISLADIGATYIAGSFGFHMNTDSAAKIGLIPPELADGLTAVGNSSLGGCVQTLIRQESLDSIEKIASQAQEINLAEDIHFNDLFMENMYFFSM